MPPKTNDATERIVDFAIPDKEERDLRWELRSRLCAFREEAVAEAIIKGRVSVLEDFDSVMKADAFVGLTSDEWKAIQKFFRYNDEISGWKLKPPTHQLDY